MKLTLLDIVTDILNDMNSDVVDSIDDTAEAAQIAQIVKSTYFAMISNRDWPHLRRGIKLDASGTSSKPTHLKLPDNVKRMSFVHYNKAALGETRRKYLPLKWVDSDEFLRMTNSRNDDADNVDVITDYSGIELLIRNDKAPEYYTSFDDDHLVCDSYDKLVDDTLQQSKTQAQGYVNPIWEMSDDFVPDLPEEAFTLLQEEAKSRASLKLNQTQDQKAEQEAGRQNRWLSRSAWRVKGGIQYPSYGRGRVKVTDPTFKQ
jgi:hypothetical protein